MNKQKFYYVYIITNNVNNKQYVGSRVSYNIPIEDNYWGSSKYLCEDYNIYGKHNFVKRIIKTYENSNDMLIDESKYMHEYNTFNPFGYNRYDPLVRKFYSYNTKHSEEHKLKLSKTLLGRKRLPCSEQTKQKISRANRGRQTWLGKHHTEETKIKIRKNTNVKGCKNPFYGKHHNKETIEILSKKSLNVKRIECPYCFNMFTPSMFSRWHNQKCKLNSNKNIS